jgi:hypothetical protein
MLHFRSYDIISLCAALREAGGEVDQGVLTGVQRDVAPGYVSTVQVGEPIPTYSGMLYVMDAKTSGMLRAAPGKGLGSYAVKKRYP